MCIRDRTDLVAAVEEAIESGHEITADDLGFTNGRTAEFEKVFFGTKGAVYEAVSYTHLF